MSAGERDALDDAAAWHARIAADDMDWDGFARWLDADPAHRRAYDRMALIDDEASGWLRTHPEAMMDAGTTNHVVAERGMRRWWLGSAVAAAVVGAISVPSLMRAPPPAIYESGRSRAMVVALRDGGRIRLDADTRLAVADRGDVRLDRGAAYFEVRHDPTREFRVRSGDVEIRDVGTHFSVTRAAARTAVAVSEGLVDVVWRGGAPRRMAAGQRLDVSGADGTAELHRIDPADVASWRVGRLSYDDAPLAVVADDISRYTPLPVAVDRSATGLRLSGYLQIGDGSHLVNQIEALLPVEARREGDRIRLVRRASRR